MTPARIGRYEIHTPLGQGGMGTVYKARDPFMDRWVALKTLTVQDAAQRARFRQEVQAAGKLNHPNITTIYDVGEEGDLAYIVMELVEGDTLASRLSAPVVWSEAINLLLPICHALAYAHRQGVIHRDVKPANILRSSGGQVKLTDFGVARLEAALRRITESGSTVGTPLYTAPEQIQNEDVDGRADLFSLGIVLYELMAGQHPFIGENLAQVVYRITQPEPANLEPLVGVAPPIVVESIGRALSKDRTTRFANANEMAQALTLGLQQVNFIPVPPAKVARPDLPASVRPLASPSLPIIDVVASNLTLSLSEETLLKTAFAGHDRVFLEREFGSGYSGSRVLLTTPVRSGRRLAQIVVKLGPIADIEHEWQAYQEFVKDTLPPVTARIMEEPLRAKEGSLALLQYNFAGGLGHTPPESLRAFYGQHSGEEVATLLDKNVFRAFGSKWWLQRRSSDLILRREYDRLLPVHWVIETRDMAEATATPQLIIAGKTNLPTFRRLEAGQLVQLQDFTVAEVSQLKGEFLLHGPPPSGSPTNPIRIRVNHLSLQPLEAQTGQRLPTLIGVITATRHDLLIQLAQSALPNQDFSQKQILLGRQLYPNPLYDYDLLLDQHLSAMTSTIHGDLNFDNILVTPSSRLAWLIDFATTRQGHNLYDFMRLETQILTKFLPQTQQGPEAATLLMQTLHQPDATPDRLPPELQKPFTVLVTVRQMVKVCMYNRENWDEYYLGLTLMLLGSLKFKELDSSAKGMALAAAAVTRGLIMIPTLRVTLPPIPAPVSPQPSTPPRMGLLAVGVVIGLVVLIGLVLWVMGLIPSTNSPPSTVTSFVAITTPTSLPTFTPLPSPTELAVVTPVETIIPPIATTPPPSPTFTPTPEPATPTPTPCSPSTHFATLLAKTPDLGCVLDSWQSDFTFQRFEQGLMIWRKTPAPAKIYILYENSKWQVQADPQGPPQPSCPEADQTGGLGPIFSFGVLWCNGEKDRLGLPLSKEAAAKGQPIEQFDGGLAFTLDQSNYLLWKDGRWTSFPLNHSPDNTPSPPDLGREIIESFDAYEPGLVSQSFTLNNAWGKNSIEIGVTNLADAAESGQSLALTYDIEAASPDNYVGFEHTLSPVQDWSNYSAVRVWVRNDNTLKDLIFQWGETQGSDGEVWKSLYLLQPNQTGYIDFPLNSQYFEWADWSKKGNQQMDLSRVSQYAFYIASTSPSSGRIYLDSLELLAETASRNIQPPTPEPATCQISPAPEFEWLWDGQSQALGCAIAMPITLHFIVEETFQGGRLVWREDTNEVYLINDRQADGMELFEGQWQAPPWKWDGQATCPPEQPPPASLYSPERGFGWLWCTHLAGPNGLLGWALNKEQGFNNVGRSQLFEHGLVFKGNGPKIYALLENGRFLAEQDATKPAPPPTPVSHQETGFEPAPIFSPLWEQLGQGEGALGYPLGAAIADRNYARQPFEHGFMFWWESLQDPQPIWVIYTPDPLAASGDKWTQFDNRWVAGMPEFPADCPQAGPPLGPKNGFGLTWCYETGVKEQIGLPRDLEFGSGNTFPKGEVQFFQGGVMLENPTDRQVLALIDSGGWYRRGY